MTDTLMLTYEELAGELAKYTYRDGWALKIFMHEYDGPTLFVVAPVKDGYNPNRMIDLGVKSPIPPMYSAEQFGKWLLWRLLLIESHECREMLRYKGELVADPHADDA